MIFWDHFLVGRVRKGAELGRCDGPKCETIVVQLELKTQKKTIKFTAFDFELVVQT